MGIKKTKWFYLAPLAGKWLKIFPKIVDFAKKNKIKVMANPGHSQLKISTKKLYPLLKKIDILLLNLEEAKFLIRNFSLKSDKLIKEIRKIYPGILIITNGKERVFLVKDNKIFSALPRKVKIVDKTGAGDAFGAGFLAEFIKTDGNLRKSLKFAILNSTSCLKKWGAKEGIL